MGERSRWRAQKRQWFGGRPKFGVGLPGGASGRESACQDVRESGLVPGLGRSPGGGHGNPFQYSCMENPMNKETRWAAVRRATNSWT